MIATLLETEMPRRLILAASLLALSGLSGASLEGDGVWTGGMWDPGVWADGVWSEEASPVGGTVTEGIELCLELKIQCGEME